MEKRSAEYNKKDIADNKVTVIGIKHRLCYCFWETNLSASGTMKYKNIHRKAARK